jgi:hypothetical protein
MITFFTSLTIYDNGISWGVLCSIFHYYYRSFRGLGNIRNVLWCPFIRAFSKKLSRFSKLEEMIQINKQIQNAYFQKIFGTNCFFSPVKYNQIARHFSEGQKVLTAG